MYARSGYSIGLQSSYSIIYVCRKSASRQEEAWRSRTRTQEKAAARVLQGTLDVSRETALSRGSSKVWQGKVEGDCQHSHDSVSHICCCNGSSSLLVVACLLGFKQVDRVVAAKEKRGAFLLFLSTFECFSKTLVSILASVIGDDERALQVKVLVAVDRRGCHFCF